MIDVMRCLSPVRFTRSDDFLRLLPGINRYAARAFRFLGDEARNEAVQEVVAKSFSTFRRLLDRGRVDAIAAAPLARYAITQTKEGRCLGGEMNSNDVSSRYCQRRHAFEQTSLEQIDDATGAWMEILVEDPSATPADTAAIRLDFQAWLCTLSERQRQIAELLSTGETTHVAAKMFGVTPGRISQMRAEFHEAWKAFQTQEMTSTSAI